MNFISRRSPVLSLKGSVAASQPLAVRAGVSILEKGGNAADAAVAVAAALNVTEPCSTGLGGDSFCLFYDNGTKEVHGLNGSGRSPTNLTLDLLQEQGYGKHNLLPIRHAYNVTVPGAAAAWLDTIETFGSGKISRSEILQPAINLATEGFPVSAITAYSWNAGVDCLLMKRNPHGRTLLLHDKAPLAGEVMRMPVLAKTLNSLAVDGKDGFYKGRIAKAIADIVQSNGGVLSVEDMEQHETTFDNPIKVTYKGINVWEMPPNGQGITALLALNLLKGIDTKGMGHNSIKYLSTLIQAMQLGFADSQWYCADPAMVPVPVEELLSDSYAAKRRLLINPNRALDRWHQGSPTSSSDTVYFSVVDSQGNACSFINSNYMGFGTGLVPDGCGFTLQNRGANFSLQQAHPNVVAPRKRPYHTIIPGMATFADSGDLYASFGVMGGFMQPQGHVQVLLNMIEFDMDPQAALDMPRFCIMNGKETSTESEVAIEEGIGQQTLHALASLGYRVRGPICNYDRELFGRGQIIQKRFDKNNMTVYWAGSDGRADGLALASLL